MLAAIRRASSRVSRSYLINVTVDQSYRIQHAASQILRAIEAGGEGWSCLWKAWLELLHDVARLGLTCPMATF